MTRADLIILIASLVLLTGCSRENDEPTPPAAVEKEIVRTESWREARLLMGQEIYEKACASCHDQGEGEAPAIGDRDAWSDRSDLWTAVLAGHAQAGYLEMPEKGGHGELSDDDISAAVEYMLLKTFPERPRD
jgi:cytochrome c oxidase cbb3-type subunit 3